MKVSRIAHEKKTVELMIRLYCRKKEKTRLFVPTVKSCFAMRMPVSTVVRLREKGCMQRVHGTLLQACPARTNATGNAFFRTENVVLCTPANHTTFIEPITY